MELLESAGMLPTSARSLAPMRLWRPGSVADAVTCLTDCERPVVLAGGSDLVAQFNEGLMPCELVDISRIDAMTRLRQDAGVLHIGARVTHSAGSADPRVRDLIPGFARAWARIANPRIRLRATLGGNLMARRTRYEVALLLQALEGRLKFATAHEEVQSGVEAVWSGTLPERALLTAVEVDARALLAFDYERSLRPLMTQALSVWRDAGGLRLHLVLATEYLAPVSLSLLLPGMAPQQLAGRAAAIARDLFAGLSPSFADTQVTVDYARHAGAALLARQLESLHV